jgi:hypothetical protein
LYKLIFGHTTGETTPIYFLVNQPQQNDRVGFQPLRTVDGMFFHDQVICMFSDKGMNEVGEGLFVFTTVPFPEIGVVPGEDVDILLIPFLNHL